MVWWLLQRICADVASKAVSFNFFGSQQRLVKNKKTKKTDVRTCWGPNFACSLCCLKVQVCTGWQSPKTNNGEQLVRYHWQNYAHIPFRRWCYDPVIPTVFWPFITAVEGLRLHPPCFYVYFVVSYRERAMATSKYKYNERSHLKVIAKVFFTLARGSWRWKHFR